jgi:E3 ubiquitin-protein ligase mind-bomb
MFLCQQCIGHVGTVHRVTERGDIRVQFDGSNQRWTFHPRAIYRLSAFSVGDAVRLTDDIAHVKLLQRGHGEWVDIMRMVRVLIRTSIVETLRLFSPTCD